MRILACLALALFASGADAQRQENVFAERGDLAVSIGLVGLDDLALRPLDGGLGVRYRIADRTVLGGSVGYRGSSREAESGDRTNESDFNTLSLSVWAERHVGTPRRTVSPFVGAGVRAQAGASDIEFGIGDGTVRTQSSTRLGVGAGVLLGAEVRLARGVTLGGAYVVGAEYLAVERSESGGGEPYEESSWETGVGATQVALSVYF